jgi:ComF family protein
MKRFSALRGTLSQFSMLALDAVMPPRCLGCRAWLEGTLANGAFPMFCPRCEAALPLLRAPLCVCCGIPDSWEHPSHLCSDCHAHPPAFAALRSLYAFEKGAREAIHAVKYGGYTVYAPALASRLVTLLDDAPIPRECLLVPVPLHPWRRWKRGFNQSELLAGALAAVRSNSTVLATNVLRRSRWTTSQVELDEAHRAANVHDAFVADGQQLHALPALPVVLLDDVATTGATLNECARALRAAGAEQVFAVTFARRL